MEISRLYFIFTFAHDANEANGSKTERNMRLQFILKTRNKQERFNVTLNLSMIIVILKTHWEVDRALEQAPQGSGHSLNLTEFKEHLDTALRTMSWIPGDPFWSQELGWMIHVGIFKFGILLRFCKSIFQMFLSIILDFIWETS